MVESVSAMSIGRAAEVGTGAAEHVRFEPVAVVVQVADRIGVEPAPVAVDRAAHGPGVGGEVEPAHVDEGARDPELRAHVGPVERGVGLWGGRDLVEVGETGGRQGEAGTDQ